MPRPEDSAARRTAALLTGLVLGSSLVGYGSSDRSIAGLATATSAVTAAVQRQEQSPEQVWADQTLRRMTLEQKVGQLFVAVVYGDRADVSDERNRANYGAPTAADVVARYHLGGVVYFTWSSGLSSPRQIAELSNGLQRAALGSGAGVPLLISTDQESGRVVRIGPPVTPLPTARELGRAGSADDARTAAEISGRELRAMGVNQNLAPVADVDLTPGSPVLGTRSFSADPQVAAAMTGAAVAGYQLSVAATAKHFPGHGATTTDSHANPAVIDHDREQWERLDAPPFRAAIQAGIDVIMLGHLVLPRIDPSGLPATLSPALVDGLLRQDLGFRGVVMTDALSMGGVRAMRSDELIPVLAVAAGADLLLMPSSLELAYRSVLAAVRSGELTEQRVDQSVRRILELKWRRGLAENPLVDPAQLDAVVGSPAHREQGRRLVDAVTGRR